MARSGWGSTDLGGTVGTLNAGAALRVAWWPGAPDGPGTIVLVQGRAEFIEVYAEAIGDLRRRGWAVVTFDFRGQGGSERRSRRAGHVSSFRAYGADLAAVVRFAAESGLPRPFHILAHSMGGLVALLAAERLEREVERMVLLAPLLAIEGLPVPERTIGLVAAAGQVLGFGRLPVGRWVPGEAPFETNKLTTDPARYRALHELVAANPDLLTGPPTLGWLAAAVRAMRHVRRLQGQVLPIPALMLASGQDAIVSTPAIDRFGRAAVGGGVVLIPGAKHQLLLERNALRAPAFAAIDAFLDHAARRLATPAPAKSRAPLPFVAHGTPAPAPAPAPSRTPDLVPRREALARAPVDPAPAVRAPAAVETAVAPAARSPLTPTPVAVDPAPVVPPPGGSGPAAVEPARAKKGRPPRVSAPSAARAKPSQPSAAPVDPARAAPPQPSGAPEPAPFDPALAQAAPPSSANESAPLEPALANAAQESGAPGPAAAEPARAKAAPPPGDPAPAAVEPARADAEPLPEPAAVDPVDPPAGEAARPGRRARRLLRRSRPEAAPPPPPPVDAPIAGQTSIPVDPRALREEARRDKARRRQERLRQRAERILADNPEPAETRARRPLAALRLRRDVSATPPAEADGPAPAILLAPTLRPVRPPVPASPGGADAPAAATATSHPPAPPQPTAAPPPTPPAPPQTTPAPPQTTAAPTPTRTPPPAAPRAPEPARAAAPEPNRPAAPGPEPIPPAPPEARDPVEDALEALGLPVRLTSSRRAAPGEASGDGRPAPPPPGPKPGDAAAPPSSPRTGPDLTPRGDRTSAFEPLLPRLDAEGSGRAPAAPANVESAAPPPSTDADDPASFSPLLPQLPSDGGPAARDPDQPHPTPPRPVKRGRGEGRRDGRR